MKSYQEVLEFWFGNSDDPDYGKPKKYWFVKDEAFDQTVRSQFVATYQQAAEGNLNHWQEFPLSCLALIIVLDQFPRNMFRGQPQAFATDDQALSIAEFAIAQGFDQALLPVQRWFIYLPFEHSENLKDQQKSVELLSTLRDDPDSQDAIDYGYRHLKVIAQFGRFPHRNAILGRQSTPAEEAFLSQPKSSF